MSLPVHGGRDVVWGVLAPAAMLVKTVKASARQDMIGNLEPH